jgi:hypothetical protein
MCVTLLVAVFVATVFPASGYAQFDLGKVKKAAEKQVDKLVEKDGKEEKSTTTTDADHVSAPAVTTSTSTTTTGTGGDPEQELRNIRDAVQPLLDIRSVYPGMLGKKNEAQNFHDHCKTADYAVNRTKTEALIAANPDLKRTHEYDIAEILTRFPVHFAELIDAYLIKEINGAIELAYAEKAKGESHARAALEAAEAAWLTADGILLVQPDHARAKELRADAQAAKESMGAAMEAVFTSSFHKEHVGKIVFAKTPITAGQESSAGITDAFTAQDHVYGMMYFNGTFSEMTGGSNVAHTILLVDDNQMESYVFKLDQGPRELSWLRSEIIPDPDKSTTRGALLFTAKLKDVSPRRHRITVRTTDAYNTTIAEGSFSLDCSGGTERIAEIWQQLGNKKLSAVSLPAPAMKNAALEKEMMAALGEWKETPLKVIITDRDWTIQHHPVTGAIVSRTINTTTVVKKVDGNCRMFQVSYRQQYAGGRYGKAQQYGVGDSADILCEKVK